MMYHAEDEFLKLRDYIFDEWLPTSGYRQSKDYESEVCRLYPSSDSRHINNHPSKLGMKSIPC